MAAPNDPAGAAVVVCQREYEQTRDPATGVLLAYALHGSENTAAAAGLANDLLATSARADALHLLGRIANDERRYDEALRLLEEARKLHDRESRPSEVAQDLQELANTHTLRSRYADALEVLDECVAKVQAGKDRRTEGYCRLAAARVLGVVGYRERAEQELDRASGLIEADRERALLFFEQGNLAQRVERHRPMPGGRHRAVASLEQALDHARRAQLSGLLVLLQLNLSYSYAVVERFEDAERALAEATALDRDRRHEADRSRVAGHIAYHRKNYALAASIYERVYPDLTDEDDRLDVAIELARIALAQQPPDLAAAEQWARRGIEEAEDTRGAQSKLELRPWVLASRRAPFELLFSILARAGRTEEAVRVFDQWQSRTLLDAMAEPSHDAAAGLGATADRVRRMVERLPSAAQSVLLQRDPGTVIETLRGIELVALVVADGVVWRITARDGAIDLHAAGLYEELRKLVDDLWTPETSVAASERLGKALLTDAIASPRAGATDRVLHVVLDPQLGTLPVAALRRGGRPLAATRRVLHLPRLPAAIASCIASPMRGGAVVIADAREDLPDAKRESSDIAAQLKTTPLTGNSATSQALLDAGDQALLHVAVHATSDTGGGKLEMYDGDVTATDIAARRIRAGLVVLASCSAARSADPKVSGSLTTAFLAAGASRVVGTLRPINDTRALALTARFYDEGGADDPIGALARVQAALAADITNLDWPAFAIYSATACAPATPATRR